MNEMTLPSRHRIRNSSPGVLRPSRVKKTIFDLIIWEEVWDMAVKEKSHDFLSGKLKCQSWVRTRDLRLSKHRSFNHCTSVPALVLNSNGLAI